MTKCATGSDWYASQNPPLFDAVSGPCRLGLALPVVVYAAPACSRLLRVHCAISLTNAPTRSRRSSQLLTLAPDRSLPLLTRAQGRSFILLREAHVGVRRCLVVLPSIACACSGVPQWKHSLAHASAFRFGDESYPHVPIAVPVCGNRIIPEARGIAGRRNIEPTTARCRRPGRGWRGTCAASLRRMPDTADARR